MYSRHRSPGNGYSSRSNNNNNNNNNNSSMGMGMGMGMGTGMGMTMGMPPAASSSPRISPDNNNNNSNNSMRTHHPGFYNNPDYRNFNNNHRAFARGHPRPYHPPPPPRKPDLFMEAGRLAAEYLVSKGFLPPTVLPPPKWPNATTTFKKQPAEILDPEFPPEGRMSALARLGNPLPDPASTRRRFPDDYNNPTASRNNIRGRRRMDSFRDHSSDWDRDYSRSGSWSDKRRTSPNNNDSLSEHHEDQQGGQTQDTAGGGFPYPQPSALALKSEDAGSSETNSCKLHSLDDIVSKSSPSDTQEDIPLETQMEITNDMKTLNAEIEEVRDGSDTDETEKYNSSRDLSVHNGEIGDYSACKHGTDLLSLCKYAKVPTRTRSSLAYRSSKVDTLATAEGINTSDIGPPIGSVVSIDDNETIDGCLGDELSYPPHALGCLDSEERAHSVPSENDVGESGPAYAVEQGKCMRSHSFPDKALIYGRESSQQTAEFGRCSSMDSMVKERGEKRAIQHMDKGEASKKPREWFPSMVTEADEFSNLSSFNGKQSSVSEGRVSPGVEVVMAGDEDNSVDISLFQKGVGEPSIEYAEEQQLLPSSFKICDLNLIEASDINDNQDHDLIRIYPSISKIKNEAPSIDIDLTISNDCVLSDEHNMHATDNKEVEVIDLENDSAEEDKGFNDSEKKTDSLYPCLEAFPNNTESKSDIPDAQDGYGLMISELLGNDISTCSSVPADINSLHNEIGLHNGEEILSDDDTIYMSLGEIPISYMRVWEQPTQEYEKPF